MAQWIAVLAANANDLSSVPRIHTELLQEVDSHTRGCIRPPYMPISISVCLFLSPPPLNKNVKEKNRIESVHTHTHTPVLTVH